MHCLGRTGNERMPPGKWTAFGTQPIGASRRQPSEGARQVRRELKTIADAPPAPCIIAAAAGVRVEESARDIGEMHCARILVLELDQAAAAAAVAKAFPFRRIERLERFPIPKGSFVLCRAMKRRCSSHVHSSSGVFRKTWYRPRVTLPPSLFAGLWTGLKIANIAGACSGPGVERRRRSTPSQVGPRGREGRTCFQATCSTG